jgi:hypothetical protein
MSPVHTANPIYLRSILVLPSIYAKNFQVVFLSCFPTALNALLFYPMHATFPAYLIPIDLIILIISG